MANKLEKTTDGIRSFDQFWDEWIASTIIPLDEDIILARENPPIEKVKSWLENTQNQTLYIKSNSRKESLLFFMACVMKSGLSEKEIESIKSQTIIVRNKEQWRDIISADKKKNIIVSMFGVPEELNDGYKIIVPMNKQDNLKDDVIHLGELDNNKLYPALEKKGPNDSINWIIQKMGNSKNLLTLQRLLAKNDLPPPEWVKFAEEKEDIPFLLLVGMVGKWDELKDEDKKAVSDICGLDYLNITDNLRSYVKIEEAPVSKKNIRENFSREIRLEWEIRLEVVLEYFGSSLNSYISQEYLKKVENILNKQEKYSSTLIEGIAKGFMIISANDQYFDKQLSIKYTISALLQKQNWEFWEKTQGNCIYFAQAAPEAFLFQLEEKIKNDPQGIKIISYSYALPTLQNLMQFDSNFFRRIVNILIKLQNSDMLANIFDPSQPNTLVSLEHRIKILDILVDEGKNADVVFDFLLKILSGKTNQVGAPESAGLDYVLRKQSITKETIREFYKFIYEKAFSMLGRNVDRWSKFIGFKDLTLELDKINWETESEEFKDSIYRTLDSVYRELSFKWADNKDLQQRIEKLLLKISDGMYKDILLFDCQHIYGKGLEYMEKPIPELQAVIQKILSKQDINEIIEFVRKFNYYRSDDISIFTYQLALCEEITEEQISYLLNSGEKSDDRNIKRMCVYYLWRAIAQNKKTDILDKVFNHEWNLEYKKCLIISANGNEAYYDWLAKNSELGNLYWNNARSNSVCDEKGYEALQKFGIKNVKNYGLLLNLLSLLVREEKKVGDIVKTEDMLYVLESCPIFKIGCCNGGIDVVKDLLKELQQRQNVDNNRLFQLEIKYIDVFKEQEKREMEPIGIYRYFRENPEFFIKVIDNAEAKNVYDLIKSDEFFPFESEEQLKKWLDGVLPLVENLKKEDEKLYKCGCCMIGRVLRWGIFEPSLWQGVVIRENCPEYVVKTIEELCNDPRVDRKVFEEGMHIPSYPVVCESSNNENELVNELQKMISDYCDKYPIFSAILSKIMGDVEYICQWAGAPC